jgi:glycosyltransferase involved in cell wall biosynthesis/tetratricopeptide (TPR) repeat protein
LGLSVIKKKPQVSVVVVIHNMQREAARTLYSLSADYQQHIDPDDYEIIVVDNGSIPAFDTTIFENLRGNFRVIRLFPAPSSPAHAINIGLASARGDVIGVMIDGARIVTPGLLHYARTGVTMFPGAVVATLGWYLGYDQQRWGIDCGYTKDREDALLESIDWKVNGYRLFDISAGDETTVDGWFGVICESNALFLSRENWTLMNGVDEAFDYPGGGFVNLDLILRAFELPQARLVVLLGEGTFHQLHGGIATNASHNKIADKVALWREQYEQLRGREWVPSGLPMRVFLGQLPAPALRHFTRSIMQSSGYPPLGENFDRQLWSPADVPEPQDPVCLQLLELIRKELREEHFAAAAAVARIARRVFPDEVAILQLLQIAAPWLRGPGDPESLGPIRRTWYFLAVGRAYEILGRFEEAVASYRSALEVDPDAAAAYFGICRIQMPGAFYTHWLDALHQKLRPNVYLEIGVENGHTIALARAPTKAIGIDPAPAIEQPFQTETHIYAETSDAFFARMGAQLPQGPIDFAFIDGMHEFAHALRDFINVESRSTHQTVIAIHDTIPFDEVTQRPDRQRAFYTGDVWKTVAALRLYRPDLTVITIAAAPSGLTLVLNPDPHNRTLLDHYDGIVRAIGAMTYDEFDQDRQPHLNIAGNDLALLDELFGAHE